MFFSCDDASGLCGEKKIATDAYSYSGNNELDTCTIMAVRNEHHASLVGVEGPAFLEVTVQHELGELRQRGTILSLDTWLDVLSKAGYAWFHGQVARAF